jgi:hypothetical protein
MTSSPARGLETHSAFTPVRGTASRDLSPLCTTGRCLVPGCRSSVDGSSQKSRRNTNDYNAFGNPSSPVGHTLTLKAAADHAFDCITSASITHFLTYLTRGLLVGTLKSSIAAVERWASFTRRRDLVIVLTTFLSI